MIRLLTAILLFASFGVVAQTQVPNVFEDGTPASAAEVNANFDALETAIDAIPEGPAGPQGEQGPAGADGIAAGLTCTTDQIIKWDGSAWVCVTQPITAFWASDNPASASATRISEGLIGGVHCFPMTGISGSSGMQCDFRVLGVYDHERCVTQVTGLTPDIYGLHGHPILSDRHIVTVQNIYGDGVDTQVTITCLPGGPNWPNLSRQ